MPNAEPHRAVEEAVARLQLKMTPPPMLKQADGTVKRIRERHHIVAKMFAIGMEPKEISDKTGWSVHQLRLLSEQTPAFQALIAYYERQDQRKEAVLNEYTDMLRRRLLMSEQLLADRLNEEGDELSVAALTKLVADAADRLGYSKQALNIQLTGDFATMLEAARRRSGKVRTIEHQPSSPPLLPAGEGEGGALSLVESPPNVGSAPLLELQAQPSVAVDVPPGPIAAPRPRAGPSTIRRRLP